MNNAPPKVEVVITVHDEARRDIEQISHRLSAYGLENSVSLVNIGIISGVVSSDKLADLRRETGVKKVEVAGIVQISPPDADVQ
jgi:hypothetical protein